MATPATSGATPLVAKHWLAQPVTVEHCGIAPQSGMEPWHGQSIGLPTPVSEIMAHDLASAVLAIGANAIVSDSNRASMVRCKTI